MDDATVGMNIRQLRQADGSSLAELAKRADLTKSALSKIENGKASPPIATLMRIADALEVNIADFFRQEPSPPQAVYTTKGRGRVITRDGTAFGYAYEALALDYPRKLAEPFVLTINPDDPPGDFRHGGEEFMYMLAGRMNVTVGEQKFTMRPGDSLYFDPNQTHSFAVIGKQAARFLCVFVHGQAVLAATQHRSKPRTKKG
jgi:transcriptional regulator with XRE-family HTH domain